DHWGGIWRGTYRVGYMETPDFTTTEFRSSLFQELGQPEEDLTHILQYTALRARIEDSRGHSCIKEIMLRIRQWAINVLWSGIDDAVGGPGKGWKLPIRKIVGMGEVAEV